MNFEDFRYRHASGLWVVTAYYNPCDYETRRYNYRIFSETLKKSGIPLLTVECAFGDQPFTLPQGADVVRVRSKSIIWQKERLLNLAISWLPSNCRYVAWLDCDLLFQNFNWARDIVDLLGQAPLVQVFETCNRLSAENLGAIHGGSVCKSFAAITPFNPDILKLGHFEKHGHTGYGWAARRDLLDAHGLYEYAIIGSGDHYMAHAAFNDPRGTCLELMTGADRNQIQHFTDWAVPFGSDVRGRVAAVPGNVFHLWHGDLESRRYLHRNRELTRLGFNPYTDLVARPGRPLEWISNLQKPELVSMFSGYFASRREDGSSAVAA